jgi:SAM-dependent methyltransferase
MSSQLSLIENHDSCPVCGGHTHRLFLIERGYRLWKCSGCGLLWLWPMPSAQEHRRLEETGHYLAADGTVQTIVSGTPASYSQRDRVVNEEQLHLWNQFLQPMVKASRKPHARIFDIGCGGGGLLRLARDQGHEVWGCEMSAAKAELAAVFAGTKVMPSMFEEVRCPENYFDFVVAVDVLSHVLDPTSFFVKARTLLADGGTLVVVTGNGADARRPSEMGFGRTDWGLPEHLYFYSKGLVERLATPCGFELVRAESELQVDQALRCWTPATPRTTVKRLLKPVLRAFGGTHVLRTYLVHVKGKRHRSLRLAFRAV